MRILSLEDEYFFLEKRHKYQPFGILISADFVFSIKGFPLFL